MRIPFIAADLLRIERTLVVFIALVAKIARTTLLARQSGRSLLFGRLRLRHCLFDRQADLALVRDVDDLDFDHLILFEVLGNVLYIVCGHLGDVHHTGFSLSQIYKSTELGDAGHLSFQNISNR